MTEASSSGCQLSVCKQTRPETDEKTASTERPAASGETPAAPGQEGPDVLVLGPQNSSTAADHPDSKDWTDEKDLTPSGKKLPHPDFTSKESLKDTKIQDWN